MLTTAESKALLGFRPLSRGLFFNNQEVAEAMGYELVFVPFLGDFFSMAIEKSSFMGNIERFSSPFSGTFFQLAEIDALNQKMDTMFSSPFSGTFFQSDLYYCGYCDAQYMFSSPFLGTFFQYETE